MAGQRQASAELSASAWSAAAGRQVCFSQPVVSWYNGAFGQFTTLRGFQKGAAEILPMVSKTVLLLILPLCLLSLLMPADVAAQDSVLGQLYGSGVHAYFSGDYIAAHEQLTSAIDGGSRDPRAYYFRALVYQKLGRDTDAGRDLERGSKLEMQSGNLSAVVSKALVRIQGPARHNLETYRTKARVTMHLMQNRMRSERRTTVVPEPSVIGSEPAESDESPADAPPSDAELFNTEPPIDESSNEPIDEPIDEPEAPSPFDVPVPTEPPSGNAAPDPFGGNDPDPFGGGGDADPAPPTDASDPIGGGGDADPAPSADAPDPFGGGGDAEPAPPADGRDPFSGGPPAADGNQARGPSKSVTDGVRRAIGNALLGGGDGKKTAPKSAPTPKAGADDPPGLDDPFGDPPAEAPKADDPPSPKKAPPAPKKAPPVDDPFG